MIILIPWKPVVLVWLLLSAILWCGYVGSALIDGKNPFAPYTLQAPHDRHSNRSVLHQPYPQDASDRPRRASEFPAREKPVPPQQK
jgi:hypothetical protein